MTFGACIRADQRGISVAEEWRGVAEGTERCLEELRFEFEAKCVVEKSKWRPVKLA